MTDRTLDIIYMLKRSDKQWNIAVTEYMSKETGYPIEEYDDLIINSILRTALVDYISTCDKPHAVMSLFTELLEDHGMYSLGHTIANVLIAQQVKENGEYINGFRPPEGEQ